MYVIVYILAIKPFEFASRVCGTESSGTQGREVLFQVSEFSEPIGMFHRNFPWARVPIAISVETFPKASIPGTELDVPRLAAPCGPARGRARANLRDLTYRSSSTKTRKLERLYC